MAQEDYNVYTFRCPDKLIEKIDKLAEELKASRSELIREGIELVLKKYSCDSVSTSSITIAQPNQEIYGLDLTTKRKYSKKQIERLFTSVMGFNLQLFVE